MSGPSKIVRDGGALLSGAAPLPGPLVSRPEVSWLSRVLPGDDQGQSGACQTFGIASWCEAMRGANISDGDTLEAYRKGLNFLRRPWGEGMTVPEAVANINVNTSWFPSQFVKAVPQANLNRLKEQPLLGVYKVTAAWDLPSFQGCLDHSASDTAYRGYHLVLIAGFGRIPGLPDDDLVFVENSWRGWGWRGLGVMKAELHNRLICEIWALEVE